jgi:ATP-dependent Clp protease adapter protein ClpS
MPWEALFAALCASVAASAFARYIGVWPRFDRDVRLVISTTAALATRRGHDLIGPAHLALALSADEKVARDLAARGVDVAKLYDDIDALLPGRSALTTVTWSDDVARVLARASNERFLPTTSRQVFHVLLHGEGPVSALLARHWSGAAHGRNVEGGGPYRGRPSAKPAWVVRIWNDDRTTMEFVVTTLHDTLMLREAHAIHAMFVTHHVGSAVIHRCEKDEAMRLAKLIEDAAAAQTFPLRVTAEETPA